MTRTGVGMRWFRQMLHVARKDGRMAWWPVLAYGAVVATTTASAVLGRHIGIGSFGWSVVLVAMGMLVLAVLVQADSPARSDALWVTHPLHPSAVFAAKMLGAAVLIVGTGLLAQALALWAHAVPARTYPRLLADSALIYGIWLAIAAVVASLTRDIRAFAIVFVLGLIGAALAVALVVARLGPEFAVSIHVQAPRLSLMLHIVTLLLIVAHQYRSRRVSHGVLLVLGLLATSVAVTAAVPIAQPASPFSAARPAVSPALRAMPAQPTVQVHAIPGGRHQAEVRLDLQPASDSHRYLLLMFSGELRRADGSTDALEVVTPNAWLVLSLPASQDGRPVTEFVSRTYESVAMNLSPAQADELRRGAARLRVRGMVEVQEATDLFTMQLHPGSTATGSGERVRVLRTTLERDGPFVDVWMSRIAHGEAAASAGSAWQWGREYTYQLENQGRGEVFPLMERGNSGNPLALVLPGPESWGGSVRLGPPFQPAIQPPAPAPPDAGWLANARLRVRAWRGVGSYSIELQPPLSTPGS